VKEFYCFIPENVPSLKNSKIATARGVFHSKTVRKYLQKLGVKKYSVSKRTVENYKTRPNLFEIAVADMRKYLKTRKPPYIIGFHFVRGTRHKADFINLMQIIADLLVAHRVIPEDNMDNFIPYPRWCNGGWYSYDKSGPGVIIYASEGQCDFFCCYECKYG